MLNLDIKNRVFNRLTKDYDFLGTYKNDDGILIFLARIWDLKNMPSEDTRYRNAYDDAQQHLVNNNDWDLEQTFIRRFNLVSGDNKFFISFLQTVVHPTVRGTLKEIKKYVELINSFLSGDNFRLRVADYFEELPVYKYSDIDEKKELSVKIKNNSIPVYFDKSEWNIEYPSFTLWSDNWDDYGTKTTFTISYYTDPHSDTQLGNVKIMKKETNITAEFLPSMFFDLDESFCSIGGSESYYIKLKEILGNEYNSFLIGMRDVAMFPRIYQKFENDSVFKSSLLRSNSIEQLTRTIRYIIEGIDPNEYFKFSYTHQLPYSTDFISLNFNFEYNTSFEHRIYALIGKNGTGKTNILSQLALDLSNKKSQNFSPVKPFYGNVFTVSYSYFDKFKIPVQEDSFSYVYCGLKKADGSLKNSDELLFGFYDAVDKILDREFKDIWIKILKNFIPEEVLISFKFKDVRDVRGSFKSVIDRATFNDNKFKLSSGESVLLFMLSEIIAEIRFDSLILFDEPETHLHPNAINSLINTLFELVKEFKSFCIIATHSPLIIQEITARNIFVIMREDNYAYVNRLEHESFGENLTIITEDIFGKNFTPKHFVTLIEKLIEANKTYEEIIELIKTDELPVTSNIRLYIKTLMKNKDEKSNSI